MKKHYTVELEPGAHPEPHEYKTAEILSQISKVIFLSPSRVKGLSTPDVRWNGCTWEIKAPKSSRNIVTNTLNAALRQAPRIIIDLRRIDCPEEKVIAIIKNYILSHKKAKELFVITKHSILVRIK